MMMKGLQIVFLLVAGAHAWSSTMSSSFGGAAMRSTIQNGCNMEMKKGKSNVPPAMRGQYKKQQEMVAMRKQMEEASTAGEDGFPVFNLFVRTKTGGGIWYPCGTFKGDEKSAALAKNYADDGMMSGVSKKQLDGGIAGSLYNDQKKLKETVTRAYPQLRKAKNDMEFGYRLDFVGLSDEQKEEVVPVEPKEQNGLFGGLKNLFG